MQSIQGISDTNYSSGSMADQLKGSQLSQDDFMKLLLAQLRLQSPSSPFDSSTMMQQISQLTSLSSTQELEKTVKHLSDNMGASQVLDASRLVGKDVQVASEKCRLVEGQSLKGSVIVPKGAGSVEVSIRDDAGQIMKTINLSPSSEGILDFEWSGLNQANNPMPAGNYNVTATAVVNGQNSALPVAGTFRVNSVALDKSGRGAILNLDGLGGVNMSDLIKIM